MKEHMNDCMDEKATNLWGDLCSCEEKISVLKKEISGVEKYISAVSGSQADRVGLEKSMGLDLCKKELTRLELQKETLARLIDEAERKKLGEEIKRTPSGKLNIPWEDLHLEAVQRQVNSVFGGTE